MKKLVVALLLACSTTASLALAQDHNRRAAAPSERIALARLHIAQSRAHSHSDRPTTRRGAPGRPILVGQALGNQGHGRRAMLQQGGGAHPVVLSGTPAERLRRALADGRTRGRSFDPRRSGAAGALRASGGDAGAGAPRR